MFFFNASGLRTDYWVTEVIFNNFSHFWDEWLPFESVTLCFLFLKQSKYINNNYLLKWRWLVVVEFIDETGEKICTCKQKTFQFRHLLLFGKSLFDYVWSFFFYGSKPENHFARNLREFGVARSQELGVNQWTALDIPTLSSQSKRAKNIHCFSIHIY